MMQFPMLSVILFLPLVGAVGAAALPRRAGWAWAMAAALADLGVCVWLVTRFDTTIAGFQFTEHLPWLPDLGINYALGVDGVNVFLVGLNALLTVVALGASWRMARSGQRSREYFALMLLLSMGMQGVFLATNLFLFYVFWELMLVPAYLLIGIYGGPRRAYAAIKFVLYTVIGSLLMLIGIIALGAVVSGTSHAAFTLDLPALLRQGVPQSVQVPLFLAFAAAFAVKVGLFPFHSWVPDAYTEAPAAVVVLVAGVMAKTGAYGFVRFCLALFPQASHQLAGLLEVLAVIGILYFALEALVAQDFKQLLAYVSISHMGVIVLGIFALNVQGVEGGILQMVNHGILIAALFLIADAIEERTSTRRLADFGGLAARLPWLATVFLIVALAALGLPGLNSFAGEFLAFLGTFHANYAIGALGTLVVIPAAWYMLRFFQGVTEGPMPDSGPVAAALAPGGRSAHVGAIRDLRWGEFLPLLPLLALIFYLGVVPGVVTLRLEKSVTALPPLAAAPGVSTASLQSGAAGTPYVLEQTKPSSRYMMK
ncbi:MAG: NADH-quinone oxidoreductase subunit M [Ktedonobacterales bacterium]|nr:NADH-quinone oxidoreductase subunit M [Ktedonobacterales bacterium]